MRLSRPVVLVVAALLVVGCGGKVVLDSGSPFTSGAGGGGAGGAGGGSGLACDTNENGVHICEALLEAPSSETSEFEMACTAGGGTAVGACSSANLLGVCAVTMDGISVSASYYASATLSAAEAQQACMATSGTWTPG